LKLVEAFSRVLATLPKDTNSPFYRVRINSNPSSVFTTDGINSCSVLIEVNNSLPDILCHADDIKKLIKNKNNLEINSISPGFIQFVSDKAEIFYVRSYPVSSFPEFPFKNVANANFIEIGNFPINSILFSASKGNKGDSIGLPYVNITSKYFEATDRVIFSRLYFDREFPWEGVLRIGLFNKWQDKDKYLFYVDENRVYFKSSNEIRSSILANILYPNTDSLCTIPSSFSSYIIEDKKYLEGIIKQAVDSSKLGIIEFKFSNEIYVGGITMEDDHRTYTGVISTDISKRSGILNSGTLCINGKYLLKAIKKFTNPICMVFSSYPKPFVLFDKKLFVCVFPIFCSSN
jgi:hypothetical protein